MRAGALLRVPDERPIDDVIIWETETTDEYAMLSYEFESVSLVIFVIFLVVLYCL